MATKKKATASRARTKTTVSAGEPMGPLRGVPLVDAMFRAVAAAPDHGRWHFPKKHSPLPEASIAAIRLGNGEPLPPSIRRALAVVGPHRELPGRWEPGGVSLEPLDIVDVLTRHLPADLASYFDVSPLVGAFVAPMHWLGEDDPWRFLYAGRPDAWGEYPVVTMQLADGIELIIEFPGTDLLWATRTGVVPNPPYLGGIAQHREYGPMLGSAVKLNFTPAPKRSVGRPFAFAALGAT